MKLELHIPLTNNRGDLDAEAVLRELSASSIASMLVASAMSDGV